MSTLGTKLYTWLFGEKVGEDLYGNFYYKTTSSGRMGERRWVIYKDVVEASKIPAEWHAWLHKTTDIPLNVKNRHPWQKAHKENKTGTPEAYLPKGHTLKGGQRRRATGDYEAWHPHES